MVCSIVAARHAELKATKTERNFSRNAQAHSRLLLFPTFIFLLFIYLYLVIFISFSHPVPRSWDTTQINQ
jgi:hypothetical protein